MEGKLDNMKILVIANKDGSNLFIENVVKELAARGHEIVIYAKFLDDTSIRMFRPLMVPIYPLEKLSNKRVQSFDVIFCPVQSIADVLFYNKYVFSYCNMNPAFDHVRGADFVFTLGQLREPYERTFSYMPVGMPKNDTAVCGRKTDSRRILVIDSGHFPFAESGKKQVAGMVLEMCREFPENEICVKPRWLPETDPKAMTHINLKHLYAYIDELCGGRRPENLNLLTDHLDLQELIDGSRSVVTLCTTAYLDVALRGKGLVMAKGFDNEDMYQVRKDYFDRVYAYAEGSGCVVDYREVCRYLPDGLPCRPEHLTETFAYPTGASARVADVMEYIYSHYLEYDLYPAIGAYRYEDYQEKLEVDPQLTLEDLKRWRMYCMTESVVALNRSISPDIDWTPMVEQVKAVCLRSQPNQAGLKALRNLVEKIKYRHLRGQANFLQGNEIDKSFYYAALYYEEKYDELLTNLKTGGQSNGMLQYYSGQIHYQRKDIDQAIECFTSYLKDTNNRSYLKYLTDREAFRRNSILCLLDCYSRQNDAEAMVPLLEYYLFEKNFKVNSSKQQKKFHALLTKAEEYCRKQGQTERAERFREKDRQLEKWARKVFVQKVNQQLKKQGLFKGSLYLMRTARDRISARTEPFLQRVKRGLRSRLRYYWYSLCGLFGWYDAEQKELLEEKDRFLNQSCVVIGNGPSLQARDLEALKKKGYSCFASNKIYKIFEQTDWRPDFYACTDGRVFKQNYQDIFKNLDCPLYLNEEFRKICESEKISNSLYGKTIRYLKYLLHKNIMRFYPDCRMIISGGSVTFVLISLAWMMGFRNIYLIGCDHNYGAFSGQKSGQAIDPGAGINQDYFVKDYMKPGELINVGDLEKATEGYRIARKYIERHGGHLYNATRGGKLEVLERVDLDQLLEGPQENLQGDTPEDT